MSRRFWIWLAVAAALSAAGLWWRYGRGVDVAAATAERGTAVEIVYATGTVVPVRWAKVASLVRDRIVEICDCEGKTVRKDEVLARLDDRDMQAALRELRAREDFLKREHARVTELVGRGAATTQAFERASMDLNQVQALIAVQIERISDYVVVSPMDGVVLRRDGEIGEIADIGQILFRIGVPKPLEVVAEVNEEDVPRIAVGQKALLRTDAFIDRRLDAMVREITPMGDPITKTYRVRLSLPDDTPLLPGMSVESNIVSREKPNALLVPSNAIAGSTVFVIEGAAVRARKVQAGIRGTRQTEILSGLKDGERVATPASDALKDRRRIRIVEPAAEP